MIRRCSKPWWQIPLLGKVIRGLRSCLQRSIALALGVAVFEIAIKQIELSSMGRDSQFAFYTADSAAECALYWDYRYSYFSPTPSPDTPANVTCDGRTITISDRPAEPMPSTYTYTIGIGDMNLFTDATPGNLCARVTVTKTRGADNIVRSIIHADGFNDDCSSLAENPRAIQRSVEIRY